jgi:lipid II:glycine glycyltransferase (peptidoglycan interpeptide bridge formation enzyme)
LSDKLIEAEYRKIDLDIARLDLRKGEEFLWRNLRVNFRNAVRQAKKNNLFVYRGSSKDLFEMFLKLFKKKPIGKKILLRNDFLRKEFREFSRERLVEFWVAEKDNVVVAVNYFLRHKDSVYWLHNVYLKEAMIYRANNLVLWEALKYYSNNGFNLAHLGTLGYENNGPSGYGRFKLGLNPLLERVAYFNRINNRFMGKIGDAHLRFRKLINNFIRHKI